MTTNHADRLDAALLRPGRVDLNLEFKNAKSADISNIFNLWYGRSIPKCDLKYLPDGQMSHAAIAQLFLTHTNPDKALNALKASSVSMLAAQS